MLEVMWMDRALPLLPMSVWPQWIWMNECESMLIWPGYTHMHYLLNSGCYSMCSPGNWPHTKYICFCNYTVGVTLIISIGAAANLLQLLSLLHFFGRPIFLWRTTLSLSLFDDSLTQWWTSLTYLRCQVMICRNLYIWLTSSHLGQRLQPLISCYAKLSTIDSSEMEISKSMPAIFGQFSFLSLSCMFFSTSLNWNFYWERTQLLIWLHYKWEQLSKCKN